MNPAILLVDVASANREELQSFLQAQNYDVSTAQDAETAVKYCFQTQPDLVLLFDTLSDIDSFELCLRLKKDPLNKLMPVVLVQPSLDQWDIRHGQEIGGTDIWAIPASPRDALQRIQTILRRARAPAATPQSRPARRQSAAAN